MPKTKTFSLYLAKRELKNFEDVLTQKAKDRIKAGHVIISDQLDLVER